MWFRIFIGIWFIVMGGVQALSLSFAYIGLVLGLLLVAAGIALLLGK